jgi:hypothetical protein
MIMSFILYVLVFFSLIDFLLDKYIITIFKFNVNRKIAIWGFSTA